MNIDGSNLMLFYAGIGFMVLANIGTIAAVIWAGGKALWWLSKLDSRVEKNTGDINSAHTKIRELRATFEVE